MKLMQNSGVPIYQQIADSFKTDILAGRYEQGEFLPSIRGLAKDLKISVITTMKAYEHLAAELRRALRCQEPELEIRIARQSIQLPLRKVLYAIARNHYVLITTEDGEYRAMCSFAQIEEKLTALENFMSCNRGVIINMDKVLRFGEDCIEILDGTRLPVRQKDKCTLLAHFTQYQFRHMRQELH